MIEKDEIKKIEIKIDELSESIKILSEHQNSQYTDIMLKLKSFEKVESVRSEDELYEEAVEIIKEMRQVSTSLIQRMLGVGYSKAAKLIDLLEKRGAISPAQGNKPREVLIKEDD